MRAGDGPVALVLTPTRELAEQIFRHAQKFGKVFNIRACAVFGGEGERLRKPGERQRGREGWVEEGCDVAELPAPLATPKLTSCSLSP